MADTNNPVAPENADLTRETGKDGVASARDRFQRLGEDVQDRYRKVTDEVRRGAQKASEEIRRGSERARVTYDEVTENAQKTFERARSEAGNVSREVSLDVRDNPGKAVLIAAGVGFLLGLVARGRGGDRYEE
ncbi:MAG TPA: hypothetical protein VLE27_16915 [Thermoanaerobaculia bacterium]|nr:hypothetical protein [Thermoanaerobaculia bacterium]